MDKKYNNLFNWGLGLGIVSVFFHESFIFPITALIVNYIAFKGYNYISNDKGLWKCITGFF